MIHGRKKKQKKNAITCKSFCFFFYFSYSFFFTFILFIFGFCENGKSVQRWRIAHMVVLNSNSDLDSNSILDSDPAFPIGYWDDVWKKMRMPSNTHMDVFNEK